MGRSTSRCLRRRAARFLAAPPGLFRIAAVLALAAGLHRPSFVLAYDCNVHQDRVILSAAEGGTSRTISLRDECFASVGATNDWPICECANTPGKIVSDPSQSQCAAGHVELGRCVAAAKYYTGSGIGAQPVYSSTIERSFVPNPATCEPCAHDVASAVLGCKAQCRRYFTGRFFEKSDLSQHNGGSWRILHPDGSNNLNGVLRLDQFRVCDVNDPNETGTCPATQAERQALGKPTALEVCERRCGPPNLNNPESAPIWNQPGDAWSYVNHARWNPNDLLAHWLRSYNNVPDRPDPPAKECEQLVSAYCTHLDQTIGLTDGQTVQCKKNLLLRSPQIEGRGFVPDEPFVDFEGKTFDFTDVAKADPFKVTQLGMQNDGFCDHLRRANNSCSQTCNVPGDGFSNAFRFCGSVAGILEPIGDCVEELTTPVPGRPEPRGGAVCSLPPPVDDDFRGFNLGARFSIVLIASPPKASGCGATTSVASSTALVAAFYRNPYPANFGEGIAVAASETAKARWTNQTNGASGQLLPAGFGLWQTTDQVPLALGTNRVVITFTDRQLRTSGDAIDLVRTQ